MGGRCEMCVRQGVLSIVYPDFFSVFLDAIQMIYRTI